jgi:arsenate reductase (glutaredoxin)
VKLILYQKPTCTTCREVYEVLMKNGVDFDTVDYFTKKIPKAKLKELIKKMNMSAKFLLRSNEDIYKKLKLAEKKDFMDEDKLIELMVKHPDLIQRPIAEKGDKAILARPAELIKEIL